MQSVITQAQSWSIQQQKELTAQNLLSVKIARTSGEILFKDYPFHSIISSERISFPILRRPSTTFGLWWSQSRALTAESWFRRTVDASTWVAQSASTNSAGLAWVTMRDTSTSLVFKNTVIKPTSCMVAYIWQLLTCWLARSATHKLGFQMWKNGQYLSFLSQCSRRASRKNAIMPLRLSLQIWLLSYSCD